MILWEVFPFGSFSVQIYVSGTGSMYLVLGLDFLGLLLALSVESLSELLGVVYSFLLEGPRMTLSFLLMGQTSWVSPRLFWAKDQGGTCWI